jgi:ketosteroid isomerase-like protein
LLFLLILPIFFASQSDCWGQDESPVHEELRKLRDRIFASYEARDLEALLRDVHPEVIATWQNGFRARGHEDVRTFYKEMLSGDKPVVRDVKSKLTVDGLSVLLGDNTAVACGNLADQFDLTSGSQLNMDSKWTATVVKQGDRWVVASFHVSASVFDNPVLSAVQSWLTNCIFGAAAIAAVVGGVVGFKMAGKKK